jgi:hypothetical protein
MAPMPGAVDRAQMVSLVMLVFMLYMDAKVRDVQGTS